MKSLKTILLVLGVILLLVTCKKDPEYVIEDLKIASEVVVGTHSAVISGAYSYPGEIMGIKACVTEGETLVGEYETVPNDKSFRVEITGLRSGTTEHPQHGLLRASRLGKSRPAP